MPSVNHVLVVRLLVKYLHYFTSSTTCLPPSSYHNQAESALLHFKRLAVVCFLVLLLFCHWLLSVVQYASFESLIFIQQPIEMIEIFTLNNDHISCPFFC